MPTARQKILNYIIEKQSVTVDELSRVFKVTPANIRHHLSILVEQGSVKIIGQKATELKGRPAQIYSCTLQINQNNLDQLTEALLSCMVKNFAQTDTDQLLKVLASQMVGKYSLDNGNPTRRLYSAIRTLNKMNYQAHWEAHGEHPRIMLGHCPYASIVGQHPEICQMDEFVIETLLDTPVEQIEKLASTSKGLAQCVFFMRKYAPVN